MYQQFGARSSPFACLGRAIAGAPTRLSANRLSPKSGICWANAGSTPAPGPYFGPCGPKRHRMPPLRGTDPFRGATRGANRPTCRRARLRKTCRSHGRLLRPARGMWTAKRRRPTPPLPASGKGPSPVVASATRPKWHSTQSIEPRPAPRVKAMPLPARDAHRRSARAWLIDADRRVAILPPPKGHPRGGCWHRGCSSAGRVREWHSRGHGFDPRHLHPIGNQAHTSARFSNGRPRRASSAAFRFLAFFPFFGVFSVFWRLSLFRCEARILRHGRQGCVRRQRQT